MIEALAVFLGSASVLVAAAVVLTRAGDAIAEHTGVGRVWIGAVLVAGATSLPELATDVAAVRIGAPDLAAGDLFGSSMANMLILAFIDLLPARKRVLREASLDNALVACLAIVLNAAAAVLVLLRPQHGVLGVAPESLLLVLAFLAGTRAVYRHSARSGVVASGLRHGLRWSLRGAALRFAGAALVVLLAAPILARSSAQIAELSGLGATFVGTFLMGISTSLPELVASLAAIRMGAFDLAVGNLFGSNAFNMVVFFAMDLAGPTPIFAALDPSHALTALLALTLMGLGLAALVYRAERRFRLLEPDSALMVLVYAAAVWLLHAATRGGP